MKRDLLLLLALCASTAHAAPEPCENGSPLAEPWTSWRQSGRATAGATVDTAPRLILGKPVTVALRPAAQVQFAVSPGKDSAKSYAGLFTLSLKLPARVGIALSDGAWIDAARESTALVSVDHGHGPPCSGIRKIVWFDMAAGRHTLQITGAQASTIRLMAAERGANRPRPKAVDAPL